MDPLRIATTTPTWREFKARTQAALPCRFAIGTWLAVAGALLFPAQSREALLVTSEEPPKTIALLAAAALWGHASWYFSRVMLRFIYPGYLLFDPDSPEARISRRWIERLPRVLGVLAPLVLFVAVELARPPSHILSAALLGLAIVLGVVITNRRRVFKTLGPVPEPSEQEPTFKQTWMKLRVGTRRAIYLQLALLAIAIGAVTAWPVPVGQAIGSPAILVLAASSWVCLGGVLTYASDSFQFPVMRALIVWVVVCSCCNDNVHRVLPTSFAPDPPPVRPMVSKDFETWSGSPEATHPWVAPWFFVVTEGGGIRAAYWTADVLAQLQDTFENFNRRLYGISSVSGGSLGASVYASLLARGYESGQFRAKSTDILKVDSLAPVLGMALYPDMLQRISPVAAPCFDRGRALEKSWSEAFGAACPAPNTYSDPFDRLWSPTRTVRIPRLFLNSTWVETGQRAVISYPDLSQGALVDAVDVESELGRFTLAQSVHFSARFTYVSPAGLVDNSRGEWGHLVDGGYFDNSGAATALEVIEKILADHPEAPKPVIIAIRFVDSQAACAKKNTNEPPPCRVAADFVSPIEAVMNARVARGTQALATLERAFNSIEFHLTSQDGETLPLGWMLSAKTRGEIDHALDSEENQRALQEVRRLLP